MRPGIVRCTAIAVTVVDSRPVSSSTPSSGDPTPNSSATSNVARFMAADGIATFDELVRRSIDEPEWFWDAVVRFLDLRFTEPYTEVLDMTRRHRRGPSGSPAAAATSRSRASTGTPTTRRRADEPRSCGKARRATVRTLTWTRAAHAHRSHRVRAWPHAVSVPATRSACSCRWCPRRSPRCSPSRSSARSSCRSSPATAPTRSRSASRTPARSRSSPPTASRGAGKVVPMKETADAAVAQVADRCTPSSSCRDSAAPTCR